jgi:NAD(P)-dependent dehydrogenase (short-subunit alcohol dehydrogenase family)
MGIFQQGFIVYGTSRNPERVLNSVFPLVALDVRDTASIQSAIAKIISISGSLDIVINNAGVGITGPPRGNSSKEIKNNFDIYLVQGYERVRFYLK